MPWVAVPRPSQEVLDQLYAQEVAESNRPCHDCGALPGQVHSEGCDVARCKICLGQRLQCDCEGGGGDVWTGIWPGIKECYENGFVCRWEGPAPIKGWVEQDSLHFDLNRLASLRHKRAI